MTERIENETVRNCTLNELKNCTPKKIYVTDGKTFVSFDGLQFLEVPKEVAKARANENLANYIRNQCSRQKEPVRVGMGELIQRILFEDKSLSVQKKLKMLNNLFMDKVDWKSKSGYFHTVNDLCLALRSRNINPNKITFAELHGEEHHKDCHELHCTELGFHD